MRLFHWAKVCNVAYNIAFSPMKKGPAQPASHVEQAQSLKHWDVLWRCELTLCCAFPVTENTTSLSTSLWQLHGRASLLVPLAGHAFPLSDIVQPVPLTVRAKAHIDILL